MLAAIAPGSGGLIDSEPVAYIVQAGYDVIGFENLERWAIGA